MADVCPDCGRPKWDGESELLTQELDGARHGVECTVTGDWPCRLFERTTSRVRIRALESELAELRKGEEWIPVAERLPEPLETVLTYDVFNEWGVAYYKNAEEGWIEDLSGLRGADMKVTHWRPLPASPRSEPEHRDDGGSKPQEQ